MVWAYVPGRTFEGYVNDLPATARRVSTGHRVADVHKWAQDCGYWDTESPTMVADIARARSLTAEEVAALDEAFRTERDARSDRIAYTDVFAADWVAARKRHTDWLAGRPPYAPPPLSPPVNVPQWLAYLQAQVARNTESTVQATDLLLAVVSTLILELEQADTFHPPEAVAFEPPPLHGAVLLPVLNEGEPDE